MLCPITHIQVKDGIVDLTVAVPDLDVTPGQFVHVLCGDGCLLRRPISICHAGCGKLRLIFAVKGKGTQWLSRQSVGATLDMLGPLGNGFTLSDEPLLLAGGGLGVPPLLFAASAAPQAHAVLGFRTQAKAILVSEFASCEVCTDDGSLGWHGLADALVRRQLETKAYARILACGPVPMLRAVARVAAEFGVPCEVSLEERMGCGVGACLTCTCATQSKGYARVCADGPVFDAREVFFDA